MGGSRLTLCVKVLPHLSFAAAVKLELTDGVLEASCTSALPALVTFIVFMLTFIAFMAALVAAGSLRLRLALQSSLPPLLQTVGRFGRSAPEAAGRFRQVAPKAAGRFMPGETELALFCRCIDIAGPNP